MKLHVLIVSVIASLAIGSCSVDTELTPPVVGEEHVVAFSRPEAMTRATITSSLRKIGVFGYSHLGEFDDATASRIPDYFLNQDVADLPGNGTWTYDGVRKYWPAGDTKLSFFAYAPFVDVENTFALYPQQLTNLGAPTITYTVPSVIVDQIDLMWGNRMNMTYADSNNGQVAFTMDHALTRVDFEVKLDNAEQGRPFIVTFDSLRVQNVVGAGTLYLNKTTADTDIWATTRPATDADWASYLMTPTGHGGLANLTFDARNIAPAADEVDAWDWNNLFKTGQYLMLIPQVLTDQGDGLTPAQVVLNYTFTNVYNGEVKNVEEVLPIAIPSIQQWEPGMGITYQLTVSLMNGIEIEFDIEGFINGTPWVDRNGSGPVTGTVG